MKPRIEIKPKLLEQNNYHLSMQLGSIIAIFRTKIRQHK
jgi:hypothetical protein